ncbi:PDZ domain-containing protein [Granulosicoccus sp. 3-233]|uniref:PDZ domain-containing protein n=1 Tax=Granulosicoccus sp. 3-233 TaxID=3417969 RepID=UPI003D33D4DA
MKEQQAGNLLPNVVISLVAGALSCIVILMLTHGPSLRDMPPADSGKADLAGGSVTDSGRSPPDPGLSVPAPSADVATVAELREALQTAVEERAQLSATVVRLNRQLLELEERVTSLSEQGVSFEDVSGGVVHADAAVMPTEDSASQAGFRNDPSERQFEDLLAAGLDEQSARDLQRRNDQYQLSRLELLDQAAREGWDGSDRLRDSLDDLQQSRPDLREELGDSLYDQYLYETGDANRIAIDSVISGSAAAQAGLQAGDLIISYSGERTFAVRDLQQATRSGSRSESVQLVFERDGQTLTTDMLRGPLGVTLRPTRQQP